MSEAIGLRPAAINGRRMTIRVEQGKGAEGRYGMLSRRLLAILRHYRRRTRPASEWHPPA